MSERDWRPNPGPQTGFLMCPVREILYGGAKGGGKSDAIGPLAIEHVLAYGRHSTVLILRETMPQLRDLMRRVRPHCLRAKAKYNKVEKTWAFPSGAQIIFGHLSEGCDPYWGQEYSLIIVDEVTRCLPTEVDYLELLGSLRSSHGIPCRVVLTSNPGGEGHNWVKTRFMGVPALQVQRDEKPPHLERVFIPASLRDNPHLPAEYRATLEQLPDAERAAFLDGDWDAFEGAVFKLERGVHTWSWAQFKERTGQDGIPTEWRKYRCYDHGYARPGACVWLAMDNHGRAFAYREYYTVAKDSKGQAIPNEGAKHEPRKVAATIKELSGAEAYAASWTGPDLFYEVRGDQAGGVKVASHFQAEGLHFQAWTASAGSRLAGKQALHQRLAYERDAVGRIKDWPMIVFIDSECHHGIRTLATLDYSTTQPEQVDTDGEDHWYDAVSGFCKMNPLPTRSKTPIEPSWMTARSGSGSRVG